LNDNRIQAIRSDGTVVWTTPRLSNQGNGNSYIPDFQGGIVVFGSDQDGNINQTIRRIGGMTGQQYPAYTTTTKEGKFVGLEYPVVHPDGTIFTVDYACDTDCERSQRGQDATDGA
jgi:hypothetical protein